MVRPGLCEAFVGGVWRSVGARPALSVVSPATEAVVRTTDCCDVGDVEESVAAAVQAGGAWGLAPPEERADVLRRVALRVEGSREAFAEEEATTMGKVLREALVDVDEAVTALRFCADLAVATPGPFTPQPVDVGSDAEGRVEYEPVGVVGAITPWNYPIMMATWKIAPALAAGCTVVAKPSEFTPTSTLMLADAFHSEGLPTGVLSVLPGDGATGAALCSHDDVAKVSFTGSLATGARVASTAAPSAKNVTLELGGKSPAVVFADAHLRSTVEWLLTGSFYNVGQVCSATSRVLVHRDIYPKLLDALLGSLKLFKVGSPFDAGVTMGPMANAMQLGKVKAFIQKGIDEGATLECGGADRPDHLTQGYYLPPTVFTSITPDMTLWREEVFGPVMGITVFDDEEEAVALANDTDFGLAASVFTEDKARLDRVGAQIKAGMVWGNASQPAPVHLPWGGFKRSGVGREMGPNALLPFLEAKSVWNSTTRESLEWYPLAPGL